MTDEELSRAAEDCAQEFFHSQQREELESLLLSVKDALEYAAFYFESYGLQKDKRVRPVIEARNKLKKWSEG